MFAKKVGFLIRNALYLKNHKNTQNDKVRVTVSTKILVDRKRFKLNSGFLALSQNKTFLFFLFDKDKLIKIRQY